MASTVDQIVHHYPPEVMELLIDTIPRLFRAKEGVLGFFEGAGVPKGLLTDLWAELRRDRDALKKARIARTVLERINSNDESPVYLRARREVVRRVHDFEDFSLCWEGDRLVAQGLVAQFREIVNRKDSFTRMDQERERERRERMRARDAEALVQKQRNDNLIVIKNELFALFGETDRQRRGLALEGVLNRLFRHGGILVREAFQRRSSDSGRVLEQIDGVVELDGRIFLAEMKWLSEAVGKDDVSQHGMRVFLRPEAHGIFVSYTEFTESALEQAREVLIHGKVLCLCVLQELVHLLERGDPLDAFLRRKVQAAIVDRNPFLDLRR